MDKTSTQTQAGKADLPKPEYRIWTTAVNFLKL